MDPASMLFLVQGIRILAEYAQEAQNSTEPMTAERLQYYHDQWKDSDKLLEADIARVKAAGK